MHMSLPGTSATSRRDPVRSAYEVKAVVRRTSQAGPGVAALRGTQILPVLLCERAPRRVEIDSVTRNFIRRRCSGAQRG
jgi:hypothetical protein